MSSSIRLKCSIVHQEDSSLDGTADGKELVASEWLKKEKGKRKRICRQSGLSSTILILPEKCYIMFSAMHY